MTNKNKKAPVLKLNYNHNKAFASKPLMANEFEINVRYLIP